MSSNNEPLLLPSAWGTCAGLTAHLFEISGSLFGVNCVLDFLVSAVAYFPTRLPTHFFFRVRILGKGLRDARLTSLILLGCIVNMVRGFRWQKVLVFIWVSIIRTLNFPLGTNVADNTRDWTNVITQKDTRENPCELFRTSFRTPTSQRSKKNYGNKC